MPPRLRILGTAAILGLALTACSSEAEAPAPTPTPSATASASPTPGTLVGKDAFALTLPKGWTELSDAGGAVLLGLSDQSVGGYPMNVNIVSDPTLAPVASEQLEATRSAILTESGATKVTGLGEYEIDGEQGARITYTQIVQGISVASDEISVARGDNGFIITFSFAPSVAIAERNAVVLAMMNTWTWAQ